MSQFENQEPESKGGKHNKAIFGGLGVLGLAALKFKAFGLVLLKLSSGFKFLYFLKSFLSMFIVIGIYTMLWGWAYALLVFFLILIHELGHFIFMKGMKLDPDLPFFLPFIAWVKMNKLPTDQTSSAWVALAGPLVGGAAAVVFCYLGVIWQMPWLMAAGNTGVFFNTLNLIPAKPLDGGYVLHVVSKWLLVVGTGLAFVGAFYFKSWVFLILAVLSIFTTYRALTTQPDADGKIDGMTPASPGEKTVIGVSYFTLLGVLGYVYYLSHNELIRFVPPH